VGLVTVSATYGAGGSRIADALARRLGVPLLDRAISVAVAERLAIPLDEALAAEDSVSSVGSRLIAGLAAAVVAWGAPADAGTLDEATFREEIELALADLTAAGAGVVLGRAGAVVLSDDERALHVRLDGPVERRIAAAMSRARIDRETAARQLERTDRARTAYVQHLYGVDPRDPRLYHLIIDSTTLSLETCVDLIATAARDRKAPPGRT